jgi:hypothetical protein
MSILATGRVTTRRPLIATLVGGPNTGKSSLACTFRKPYLLRTEGENVPSDIPDARLPAGPEEPLEDANQLWAQLKALHEDEHEFATLIVDSTSGLDEMFANQVMKDSGKNTLATALGGYGAGYEAVAAMHGRVRKMAEILRRDRGMSTVFIAHSDIIRLEPPDSEGYTSHSLRLHKKSIRHYVDSVDLVGFIKQETILKGEEGQKKAITTGGRVLVAYLTPANVSKNRMGITEDLPFEFGENPIYRWMKERAANNTAAAPAAEPVHEEEEA